MGNTKFQIGKEVKYTNIHKTKINLRDVNTINIAGNPRIIKSKINGIIGVGIELGIKEMQTRYNVKVIAAGNTTVPTSSIKITNCIEIQNVPHKSRTKTNSRRL